MIAASPGQTFTATYEGADGLVGTLGVRIENADGTNNVPRTTTGIVEVEAGSGVYAIETLTAPVERGTYLIVWDTGGGAPEFTAEPLIVSYAPTASGDGALLISAADARVYLRTQTATDPPDEWLEPVIAGLSAEIERFTGRSYLQSSPDPATRIFPHDHEDATLDIDDARSLSLVEASSTPNIAESWQEIDAAYWVAEPLAEDVKRQVRFLSPDDLPFENRGWIFPTRSGTEWPHAARSQTRRFTAIRVTAVWGAGVVPENVALACRMWIQNIYKRDAAFFSDQLAQPGVALKMPGDVREILEGEHDERAAVVAI